MAFNPKECEEKLEKKQQSFEKGHVVRGDVRDDGKECEEKLEKKQQSFEKGQVRGDVRDDGPPSVQKTSQRV